MNAHDIGLFEALLRAYELDTYEYTSSMVVNMVDNRLDLLFDKGIEEGEEVEALIFMYRNAENYAKVLEDREADEAYERALLRAVNRKMIDPFYTIV